jgi:hypothetical protein
MKRTEMQTIAIDTRGIPYCLSDTLRGFLGDAIDGLVEGISVYASQSVMIEPINATKDHRRKGITELVRMTLQNTTCAKKKVWEIGRVGQSSTLITDPIDLSLTPTNDILGAGKSLKDMVAQVPMTFKNPWYVEMLTDRKGAGVPKNS